MTLTNEWDKTFPKSDKVPGVGCSNDWCEPVSDEEYNKL